VILGWLRRICVFAAIQPATLIFFGGERKIMVYLMVYLNGLAERASCSPARGLFIMKLNMVML
jgi:hypothetical protein